MATPEVQLIASINLTICAGCFWACLCRLNSMSAKVCKRVRLQFVLLLVGSLASGLQPMFFQQWPGVGQTLFSAAVLIGLVLSMSRWKSGPPEDLLPRDDES